MNVLPYSLNPPANFLLLLSSPKPPVISLTKQPDLIAGIPDGILAVIAPVVAYWLYSSFFHIIDVYTLAEKYRIHPSEEEQSRNKASHSDVIQDVILQHVIQTVAGLAVYMFDPTPQTGHELNTLWRLRHSSLVPSWLPDSVIYVAYTFGWPALRVGIAMTIIDTWQFWLHRLMHVNKALYRRFHSRHHRLYVPYAYGALYNDPVEGFLLDTLGTGIAAIATGLLPREQLCLFVFATMKTVDDHCGYRFPLDPFQIIFPNNLVYHDIHHQQWGIKHNFSQPFFTFWDRLNLTEYIFANEYKEMQNKITLQRYKEFLSNRRKPASAATEAALAAKTKAE